MAKVPYSDRKTSQQLKTSVTFLIQQPRPTVMTFLIAQTDAFLNFRAQGEQLPEFLHSFALRSGNASALICVALPRSVVSRALKNLCHNIVRDRLTAIRFDRTCGLESWAGVGIQVQTIEPFLLW